MARKHRHPTVRTSTSTFGRHKSIRDQIRNRLADEGRYDDYRVCVQMLKDLGFDDSGDMAAWKIAALAYAPLNGGPGEIKADPMFDAIVSRWNAADMPKPPGFAKFPNGLTNFSKLNGEPSPEFKAAAEKIKSRAKEYDDEWENATLGVIDRVADPAEVAQWVMRHANLSLEHIDVESVPDPTALTLLKMVKSPAVLKDFVTGIWSKLLPDRKTLEYQAQRADDGRKQLGLLEEFERGLEAEEVL